MTFSLRSFFPSILLANKDTVTIIEDKRDCTTHRVNPQFVRYIGHLAFPSGG